MTHTMNLKRRPPATKESLTLRDQRALDGSVLGRGERIRTSGLYVPNVALYQAKLHPEKLSSLAGWAAYCVVSPAGGSSEKAAVAVVINGGQGVLKRFMHGLGFVKASLQARSHPIQAPMILSTEVPDPGEGTLPIDGLVQPVGSDLVEVDGMTHDGIAEIKLRANLFRR